MALPRITSENRDYLPVGLLPAGTIISSQLFAFYNPDLLYFSLLVQGFIGYGWGLYVLV